MCPCTQPIHVSDVARPGQIPHRWPLNEVMDSLRVVNKPSDLYQWQPSEVKTWPFDVAAKDFPMIFVETIRFRSCNGCVILYLLRYCCYETQPPPLGHSGDVTGQPSSAAESWSWRVRGLRAVSGTHPAMASGLAGQWNEKKIYIDIRGHFKWISVCIVKLHRAWRGAASSWSRISDLGSVVTPHQLWGKDGGPGGVHHQSDVPL